MQPTQLRCPACGGALPPPTAGQEYAACPYCRTHLRLQPGRAPADLDAELDRLEQQATLLRLRLGQPRGRNLSPAQQEAQATLRQTEERIAALRHQLHLPVASAPARTWRTSRAPWITLGAAILIGAAVAVGITLWATPWLGTDTVWIGIGAGILVALGILVLLLLNSS